MAGQLPPGFQIDPALSVQMGTTVAVNPTTGKKIKWREGPGTPEGTVARPEFGAGAYETSDGAILRPTAKGGVQTMRGPQTAAAEARTRLALGLGPTVEAQRRLYELERWNPGAKGTDALGSNPHDTFRGSVGNILMDWADTDKPAIPRSVLTRTAKSWGGQDFRDYQQAAKTFEAAFLPILSGASVTPSEAARQLRANLPEPGDDPRTLAQKSKQRAMMINAAAKLLGEKPPFPRIPTMDLGSLGIKAEGGAAAPPAGGGGAIVIDINGRPIK